MANVEEVLSTIDAGLHQYLPIIAQVQNNYYNEKGKYAQGLFTHSSPPTDENSEAPDQLDLKPTDQDETWEDLAEGLIPAAMNSRMRIDTYLSSKGHGYVIVLEKIINGDTYRKSHNVGPETQKSHDWQMVVPIILEEDE